MILSVPFYVFQRSYCMRFFTCFTRLIYTDSYCNLGNCWYLLEVKKNTILFCVLLRNCYIHTFAYFFEVKITFALQFQFRFRICFTYSISNIFTIYWWFVYSAFKRDLSSYRPWTHFCEDNSLVNFVRAAQVPVSYSWVLCIPGAFSLLQRNNSPIKSKSSLPPHLAPTPSCSVCQWLGALTLRSPMVRPPVHFFFRLGGPIDPQRAV